MEGGLTMGEHTPHDPRAGLSRGGHRLFSPVPAGINALGALLLALAVFVLLAGLFSGGS